MNKQKQQTGCFVVSREGDRRLYSYGRFWTYDTDRCAQYYKRSSAEEIARELRGVVIELTAEVSKRYSQYFEESGREPFKFS